MSRRSKKKVATTLAPKRPIHVAAAARSRVAVASFDAARYQEGAGLEQVTALRRPGAVLWIQAFGLGQPDTLQRLGEWFDLHPLVLEDIANPNEPPKVDDFGDYIYLTSKLHTVNRPSVAQPREEGGSDGSQIVTEQISLVLGRDVVISFQESDRDVFAPIRDRLKKSDKTRAHGADFVAYALLDAITDSYFLILEEIGDRVAELEERVTERPSPDVLRAIHGLKRELLVLRRSAWPLRETISWLERRESPLIREETEVYLGDVHDHIIQILDTIEILRDMLGGMLDVYLSTMSNRMNEIMKVLTIISTIFMPLTFIAGVYGMNFHYMPEIPWRWGYPVTLGVMALVAGAMVAYFRRKKWL